MFRGIFDKSGAGQTRQEPRGSACLGLGEPSCHRSADPCPGQARRGRRGHAGHQPGAVGSGAASGRSGRQGTRLGLPATRVGAPPGCGDRREAAPFRPGRPKRAQLALGSRFRSRGGRRHRRPPRHLQWGPSADGRQRRSYRDVTSVTSVVSSDTTEPSTTVTTEGTTVSTDGPGTTQAPDTTVIQPEHHPEAPAPPGALSRPRTSTTGGTTPDHRRRGRPPRDPPRPAPPASSNTPSAQREGSARALAAYLADLVITGNTSGARALVAPEAQSSLAQMIMSLERTLRLQESPACSRSPTAIVRVTMQINDRVINANGELRGALSKFVIKVRVDDRGAVITAINAGS